jgi:hypothetical protein
MKYQNIKIQLGMSRVILFLLGKKSLEYTLFFLKVLGRKS